MRKVEIGNWYIMDMALLGHHTIQTRLPLIVIPGIPLALRLLISDTT